MHRLVRISPFNSNARRHTSFSSVTVYPVIDQSIEIDIPEKDVRIDVYRASGAGGQHVNKTESAVRITHLPTGIAVASQSERSQHQNRAICWDMLQSRLYEIELEKKKAETGAFVGERSDIGWGHQIRSYVLHFSNRPFGVKRFQTIHHCSVDVARGLVLLFGIGTKALPSWDSKTRWNNLLGGLAVRRDGRSKRTYELTSSIVPRGTSFHRCGGARVFSYRN